ncbi:hypothetical protein GURASL_00110 [Geotalea uraniireducens]|uniref:Chlororespiratory reduction protein 7 n=1 Tax=Geotalea uraniireducens TaxID=351604 RepID=A0ABN6VLU4_9BACT|nr:hypothetical protein [Geotalea uraniireducens]BDV41088.1 hypothetical protein GURASL_00110 [Geotalea uraniireducens]
MGIKLKPSDLFNKYHKDVAHRDEPKFVGKPDPAPFNRDDIYEVIPLLEAVMDELGTLDGRVLNELEDIMLQEMPRFVERRDEVFDYLVETARDRFGWEKC